MRADASGSELLIVDGIERDREGMRTLFDGHGFVCTAAPDGATARRLVKQKFFPAALVDLDVGEPGAGIDLLREIRATSRQTSVVLLTGRRSFEDAVAALRAGALDVVRKSPDQVDRLVEVVTLAAERYRSADGDELYREVRGVLADSFTVILGLSRKVYSHLSQTSAPLQARVLIVDAEGERLNALAPLVRERGWAISAEMSGGAALDRGMSQKHDIVAVSNELPDLPGSMVLRSIQTQHGDVLGLLYSAGGNGRIERVEQGNTTETELAFRGAPHLVQRIAALVDELGMRASERRIIQAFRNDHEDFLRRYAELKLKIDRLISD